jgi:hypothetical protein
MLVSCLSIPGFAIADESAEAPKGENASNPLAAVDNTDLRWQYFDLDHGSRQDYFIDGAKMLSPDLKLKYELHYWSTDATDRDENDWESLHLKLIYFAKNGTWGDRPYRLAVGAEWIKDFRHHDKGIGSGADQLAPLVGVALKMGDATLVPLVQHYLSYSGNNVNQTAFRLIGIQPFAGQSWAKLDIKVPYDWENDEVPASIELQLGKSFTPSFGLYVDGLVGLGGNKPYDLGGGIGLRFNY